MQHDAHPIRRQHRLVLISSGRLPDYCGRPRDQHYTPMAMHQQTYTAQKIGGIGARIVRVRSRDSAGCPLSKVSEWALLKQRHIKTSC